MNTREWALIAFTILSQMTVGSFLVLGIVHFYAARKKNMAEADRMSDRALVALVPVLGLAMLASLFHLGNPLNAPRAVTNFATSWLSREILATVIFGVLAVLFTALQWFKVGKFAVRNAIAWVAAVVGLVLVYSMAHIYMVRTQPAWNTIATPLTFFTTTLLLGCLAMGAAFVANYVIEQRKNPGRLDDQSELLRDAIRGIAIASVVLLGAEFVVLPLYLGYLAIAGSAATTSANILVNTYGLLFILRLALAFIGAGILGVFLYQNAKSGTEKTLATLAYSAFVIVLVAEVMGRFLFYISEYRIGV